MKTRAIVNQGIIWVTFKTKREMCQTMLRFSEHYESPKFKDKIFTRSQYKTWYVKKFGIYDYCDRYEGFNVPSRVFDSFLDGSFKLISKAERNLIAAVKPYEGKPFYVIATLAKAESHTIKHELAHGLYGTNPVYAREVRKILGDLRQYKKIALWLKDAGYHRDVYTDEVHAYLVADFDEFVETGICSEKKHKQVVKRLRALFRKHILKIPR